MTLTETLPPKTPRRPRSWLQSLTGGGVVAALVWGMVEPLTRFAIFGFLVAVSGDEALLVNSTPAGTAFYGVLFALAAGACAGLPVLVVALFRRSRRLGLLAGLAAVGPLVAAIVLSVLYSSYA